MATRALFLSALCICILFLLLTASHVLPSTMAARILEENKAARIDGEDGTRVIGSSYPPPRSGIHPQPGRPYTRRCSSQYHCPPA